jgi:hypothetical protein
MRLEEIADLLAEWRDNKERQRVLRDEMARVAVEVLKLPQDEVTKRVSDLPAMLDGYLIGQGMRQKWRDAA